MLRVYVILEGVLGIYSYDRCGFGDGWLWCRPGSGGASNGGRIRYPSGSRNRASGGDTRGAVKDVGVLIRCAAAIGA